MRRWQLHQRYIAKHLTHPEAAVPRAARLGSTARSLVRGLMPQGGHWYGRSEIRDGPVGRRAR